MENRNKICAVFMDLQEKLIANVHNSEDLIDSNCTWLNICKLLCINCVITEQAPGKLGLSSQKLKEHAEGFPVIAKDSFSAFGSDEFREVINEMKISHLIITGVETAICVYLTALDALSDRIKVTVLTDCISGRRRNDSVTALANLAAMGVSVLPLETCVYSILKSANHPQFKEVSQLIKNR